MLTATQQKKFDRIMSKNDYNWYAVARKNKGKIIISVEHHTNLSAILQCGHDMTDYGIVAMKRCGE